MSWNLPDIPFGGRMYAKIEVLALASVGARLPQGPGEMLLVFDGATAYFYFANEAGDDWIITLLGPDVSGGLPADGEVVGWDETSETLEFLPSAAAVGSYSKVTTSMSSLSGAYNPVTWTTEVADAIGGFDLMVSDFLFTAPVTGVYQHHVTLMVSMNSGTQDITIRFSNAANSIKHQLNYPDVTTDLRTISFQIIQAMTAGETLKVLVNVPSGTLDFQGTYCFWEVVRLS